MKERTSLVPLLHVLRCVVQSNIQNQNKKVETFAPGEVTYFASYFAAFCMNEFHFLLTRLRSF